MYGHNLSSSWFHIASGIKNIDYDGITYDSSFEMCRPAYEYEIAKQEVHNEVVHELIYFNFIWSGLEILITDMKLNECPYQKGKINSACLFLKGNYSSFEPLIEYKKLIDQLKYYIIKNKYKKLLNRFERNDCVSTAGLGIYVINKLRNEFAHGDFVFPEPQDWNIDLEKPYEKEIINTSSRIILMTVQMLMIAYYKDKNYLIHYHNDQVFEGMPYLKYLQILHKPTFEFNPDQLELDI